MNANRLIPCIVVVFLVAVVGYYWYSGDNGDSSSSRKDSPPSSKHKSVSKQSKVVDEKIEKIEEQKEEEEDDLKMDGDKQLMDDNKMDEGVIKYECNWTEKKDIIKYSQIKQLLSARNKLHDLKLIDVYKQNGIGFGNISQRIDDNDNDNGSKNNDKKVKFYITGTQTSELDNDKMNESHFCIVNNYDIPRNKLYCHGPIRASSESMTHATIYELNTKINCVVHIHNNKLWNQCLNKLPTTDKNIKYGTPEMAKEVKRLYENNINDIQSKKIFVMAGHEDGLISFGDSIQSATNLMIETYKKYGCDDEDDTKRNDNENKPKVSGNNDNNINVITKDEVESIGDSIGTYTSGGSGGEEESTTTDSNNGNNKNMNINIIDDYATPILGAQTNNNMNDENKENNNSSNENDQQNDGKNNGFVEIDSDKLSL